MPAGVLFVCYANLCRSPLAQGIAATMFSHTMAGGAPIPTSSAGTHARDGHQMHPHSAMILAERGYDPAPFRSRLLSASMIDGAGLVVTAGRRERAACVALAPGAIRRIFTLRQFGRLAEAAITLDPPPSPARQTDRTPPAGHRPASLPDAGRWGAVIDLATRARGRMQPSDPADDDLNDPIGAPLATFLQCAVTIEAALTPIVRLIAAVD